MADKGFQVDAVSSAPGGNNPLGADQLSDNLKGIAPTIMEAFMKRAELPASPSPPDHESQPSPEEPDCETGTWPAAVLARRHDIQALLALKRSCAADTVAAAGTPTLRAKDADPRLDTEPNPAPEASANEINDGLKAQHLALRATAKKAPQTVPESDDPVLKRVLNSLRDQRIQGRLAELTQSINQMVPGGEGAVKLGSEIGKKVLVDNLNPILALSLSTKEAMSRIDTLRKWHALTGKERLTALTALTGNLAEILGALTPPPVNVSVQVVGAGLSLMSMAADHSETLETIAKQGGELAQRQVRRIIGPQAGLSASVQGAWQTLGARLAGQAVPQRPALAAPWRWFFASRFYQILKQSGWSANLATKLENLIYNLAARRNAVVARMLQRLRQKRQRKRG